MRFSLVESETAAVRTAQTLIERTREEITDQSSQRQLIDLIESIIIRSLAKVIKIYPFVGNEVRNCRYQQSNSISDQIAVCDFCILMKVSEIFCDDDEYVL